MAVSRSAITSTPTAWTARVPLEHLHVLAMLRNEPGLVACEDARHGWIRPAVSTAPLSDKLSQRLRLIAVAELLHVTPQNTVIPWGKRVPTEPLPAGPWTPLWEGFTPQIPLARMAARPPEPAALTFVPHDSEVAPSMLRLPLSAWRTYVATAPQVRLARWEFAANRHGDVLVRGLPLPSLPGQHYWEADGLLIPCGWHWSPMVSADIVRRVLRLETGSFALADCATATWEVIASDAFVASRRQNVRGTMPGVHSTEASFP